MDYKIHVTPAAQEDIGETIDYLVRRLKNPTAASRLLGQIRVCYQELQKYPGIYEQCRDIRLREKGYRKAVIDNFILVYHPVEEERTVFVLGFFYGGRDYEKLL